jgi:transcriptional regulator with XRE-family HTH domain
MSRREEDVNRYIRERILQARREAGQTQEDLARRLGRTRVAISDLERGRVDVSASTLTDIAAHYGEQEFLYNLALLPDPQQYIALEYVKQQVALSIKAMNREIDDELAAAKVQKP